MRTAAIAALLAAGAAFAVQPVVDRRNQPISYVVPGVRQAFTRTAHEYRTSPRMSLDLYAPRAPVARGVVILVHGSAPATSEAGPKDWGFFRSYGATLAESGLTVAIPNHRLGADAPDVNRAEEDLRAVVGFLARDRSMDAAAMTIVLFSGAGALAGPVFDGSIAPFAAAGLMYPRLDPRFSAIPRVPVFLGRGGRDTLPGVNVSIDAFLARAPRDNVDLEFHNVPGGDHGFENASGDPAAAGSDVASTIESLISFLKRNVAARPRR